MSKLFLPFHVCKRSFGYYVYRWEDETKRSASRVSHHCFYEDAQKEAYEKNKEWMRQKKTQQYGNRL